MDGLLTSGPHEANRVEPWPGLARLVARIRVAAPRLGPVRLVAVDGPAGSGKSTLAATLADSLIAAGEDVRVLHLDDLYEGWAGLDGVWDRLEGVLIPLSRGEVGRFRRYDWHTRDWAEWNLVPPPGVLVVEGCGAAARAVDDRAVARIWVEAPQSERQLRGLARDGEAMRAEWLAWMRAEAAHFEREGTRSRADYRFST